MIDKSNIALSLDHANNLAALQIFAAPRAGTPLSNLVAELRPGMDEGEITVTEDYTHRLSGYADELADHIRGYLDYARNTARPAIDKLKKAVEESIVAIQVNPFSGMNVVELGVPALLEDQDFMYKVNNYNNTPMMPKAYPRFDKRTDAELLEMCATGTAAWDDLFKAWVAKQPEGTLQNVWQGMFQDPNGPKTVVKVMDVDELLRDYMKGDCSALIIFLLCTRLNASMPDDAGLDLQTARAWAYGTMQRAANSLVNAVNWFNSFVTTGSLVSEASALNKTIRVNKAVYKQYLNDGGKSDVLMGLLVSEKKYTTVADIQANAEELLRDWHNYANATQSRSQAEYELQVRDIMTRAFEQALSEPMSDAEAQELDKPGVRENAKRIFSEELRNYSREQIHKNWIDVLWRSACKGRFYYSTFVYDLLDSIDYNVREGHVDADSALFLASEKLTAKFFAEMATTA